MRLHADIPNTVALWQLQGNLLDSSAAAAGPCTVERGSALYEQVDPCLKGFTFDGANGPTNLLGPAVASLRLSGDYTIEAIVVPRASFVQTLWAVEPPGGAYALLSNYVDTGSRLAYVDRNINNFYGAPGTSISWTPLALAGVPIHVAQRRVYGSTNRTEMFINGVKSTSNLTITSQAGAAGNELFRIGGFSGAANLRAALISVRVMNIGRDDAGIAADAFDCLQLSCAPFSVPSGSRGGYGGEAF